MNDLYLVTRVYSNDEDGTWSEPYVFEDYDTAEAKFLEVLTQTLDEFIEEGYCTDKDKQKIINVYEEEEIIEEGVTSWSLMYSLIDDNFDFWSSRWFDFWCSIEFHHLTLNK